MKLMNMRRRTFKAFTLLELVIVIAIISILGAIIVPNTIERVRSSKIESANTLAYELYTATQNYLTDQQIKNKSLCDRDGKDGAFPVNGGTGSSSGDLNGAYKDKIIFSVAGSASGSTYDSDSYICYTKSSGSEADKKKVMVVNGIERYLGSMDNNQTNTGYYWAAQIDVNTYTVDWVVCCEQKDADKAVQAVVSNYENKTNYAHLYTDVFGKSANASYVNGFYSQEYDANHTLPGAYVGQYPIPYGK